MNEPERKRRALPDPVPVDALQGELEGLEGKPGTDRFEADGAQLDEILPRLESQVVRVTAGIRLARIERVCPIGTGEPDRERASGVICPESVVRSQGDDDAIGDRFSGGQRDVE